MGKKRELLFALLRHIDIDRVLIFTRTKIRARRLAKSLNIKGYRVAAMQGNMTQAQRQRALKGFKSGRYNLLVATDIAARGIDVSEISHVINYDMPDTADAYTHRIGRTGRAKKTGKAYSIVVFTDEPTVRTIEKTLNEPIEIKRVSDFNYGSFSPEENFAIIKPKPKSRFGSRRRSSRSRKSQRRQPWYR